MGLKQKYIQQNNLQEYPRQLQNHKVIDSLSKNKHENIMEELVL